MTLWSAKLESPLVEPVLIEVDVGSEPEAKLMVEKMLQGVQDLRLRLTELKQGTFEEVFGKVLGSQTSPKQQKKQKRA